MAASQGGHNRILGYKQRALYVSGENSEVKHIRIISSHIPVPAQFESILQLVGLAQALLSLFTYFMNTFGIPIPQKNTERTS
jgi:hypothetical protein